MVCQFLLQWTTFCQTSPPWPVRLGWPHMAWLSFIELDKAVVRVIRLTSFLWVWFQCVCPLMPSCNTYHLTWISLTLDEGYLLTAACWSWMWSSSSQPSCTHATAAPWMWGCSSRPPPHLCLIHSPNWHLETAGLNCLFIEATSPTLCVNDIILSFYFLSF